MQILTHKCNKCGGVVTLRVLGMSRHMTVAEARELVVQLCDALKDADECPWPTLVEGQHPEVKP